MGGGEGGVVPFGCGWVIHARSLSLSRERGGWMADVDALAGSCLFVCLF